MGIDELFWRATEQLGPCGVRENEFATADLTGFIEKGTELRGSRVSQGRGWRRDFGQGSVRRVDVTYYPRIDSQFNKLLTLLTQDLCAIGEDGYTTALITHEHISFERRDDIELRVDDAEIPSDGFFGLSVRQGASDIVHIRKCIQCSYGCIFEALDYIVSDGERRVHMFFLRQPLR